MQPGAAAERSPDPAARSHSGLTWRSLLLGLVQVFIVCAGAPFSLWVVGASEITWSYFPVGVGFPFLCLVLVNSLLRTLGPGWALQPAELITIAVMGLVVTGIPIFMVGYVMAIPTTPHYFASPENQWGEHVLPHLPSWLVPSNEANAMAWFFEGLPLGEPVPWAALFQAWVMPLFWWLTFIWTLYLVSFCMVVVMRRQWVERERLAFPLMQVPRALVEDLGGFSRFPPLLSQKLFWAGASIPLALILWNVAGYFLHYLPAIPYQYVVDIGRDFPPLNISLNGPIIGITYFANLNVSFSIWFFYLLTMVQEGLFNRFGMGITGTDTFVWGLPSTSWQSWGAFVVMVLWGLWRARSHLGDVARKAWRPDHAVDDTRELLSYRTAAVGLAVGVAYMLAWLCRAGMDWHVASLFLASVIIAYLGITRLVIQAGLYYLSTPVVGQAMTMSVFGTASISPHGLAALGLSYSFFGDVQSIFMPSAAHAAKLQDVMGFGRRGLSLAIAMAVLAGFGAAIGSILYVGYERGASNFTSWFFRVSSGAGVMAFDAVTAQIKNPGPPQLEKLAFFGIGSFVMSALTFMQYRFPWWPLHPIGLPVAAIWMIRRQAAAIFMAWLAKSLIIRFGGIDLYRRAAPFFIGLILGQFIGVGISFVVDLLFFYGNGHLIRHV